MEGDDFEVIEDTDDEEQAREDLYAEQPTTGLIPYRNVPALVGYYLAVFSLLPLFPIGIAAAICGFVGLKKVSAHPEVAGGVHAWIAVIGGGIFGLLWLGLTIAMITAI